MSNQKHDIEKTLKRILARELVKWPENAICITQEWTGMLVIENKGFFRHFFCIRRADDHRIASITRADWEAERALLASEQAQPVCNAEEFDQTLWDKVASNAIPSFLQTSEEWTSDEETSAPMKSWSDIAKGAAQLADAFMAERAKRIAARKAAV